MAAHVSKSQAREHRAACSRGSSGASPAWRNRPYIAHFGVRRQLAGLSAALAAACVDVGLGIACADDGGPLAEIGPWGGRVYIIGEWMMLLLERSCNLGLLMVAVMVVW